MKIVVADKMDEGALNALKELGRVVYLPSMTAGAREPPALAGGGAHPCGELVDSRLKPEFRQAAGFSPQSLTNLLSEVSDADILIVRSATKVTAEVVDAAKNLKIVGRAGVGIDNIDKNACDKRGITVLNTPDAPTLSVAELTICMILCVLRNVGKAHHSMKERKWLKKELEGKEIGGKTLGILGFGRIGKTVAEKANALGMKVISNTYHSEESSFVRFVDLDTLLNESDIISIHVPITPLTKNMINKETIGKMKNGVYLVNLARGEIVDEDALYDACKTGKIAGAALDVYKTEPYSGKLLELDNIIFTPHIASSTKEAQLRVGEHLVKQLKELIEK